MFQSRIHQNNSMNEELLKKQKEYWDRWRKETFKNYVKKANELIGPEGRIKFWIECFKDNNFDIAKQEAEEDFNKYKEMAVPFLIQSSYSSQGNIRHWSIYFLLKVCDPRSVQAFRDHLDDEWGATIINAAEGLYKLGDKEISRDRLLGLFLDTRTHRHTRKLAAEKLIELGFKKVIREGTFLDLSEIPPNHHDDFKKLYKCLS